MDKALFTEKIEYIINKLEERGYSPLEQLSGYVLLGDDRYITKHGDARTLVKELPTECIKEYLIQNGVKLYSD